MHGATRGLYLATSHSRALIVPLHPAALLKTGDNSYNELATPHCPSSLPDMHPCPIKGTSLVLLALYRLGSLLIVARVGDVSARFIRVPALGGVIFIVGVRVAVIVLQAQALQDSCADEGADALKGHSIKKQTIA